MSFLRPLRSPSILLRPIHRAPLFRPPGLRFATGYGDPSDEGHPAAANPQEQGSSTQAKQAEHPGPRENEPDHQGGSSFGDKGQETKAKAAPTDTKSGSRAGETSWDGDNGETGSRVHGSGKKETVLGGSLSMNKDKVPDEAEHNALRKNPAKGDLGEEGLADHSKRDARKIGGQDDTRKQR
jgi:hypothetical protein